MAEAVREATYAPNWRHPLHRPRPEPAPEPPQWREGADGVLVDATGDPRARRFAEALGLPLLQLHISGDSLGWQHLGLLQVQQRQGRVPFTITRVEADGSTTLLRSGGFAARWSPRATAGEIGIRGGRLLCTELQRWHDPAHRTAPGQTVTEDRIPSVPTALHWARDGVTGAVRMALTERRQRAAGWSVRVAPGDFETADLQAGRALPNPDTGWLADPHWHSSAGQEGLFVEEFDHADGRGHIAWMPWNDGRGGPLRRIVSEPEHLSFPWTFTVGGKLYLTMESAEARRLRIYECLRYPDRWQECQEYLVGLEAVDPIIIRGTDRWFLLVNLDSCDLGVPDNELHVFFSDDPLQGTWTPLPGNPQVVDPRGARNGGLLQRDGALYRVGQCHGYRTYGDSCRLFRITTLTETDYAEEAVQDFDLGGGRGPHTLTGPASWLVFDVHEFDQ